MKKKNYTIGYAKAQIRYWRKLLDELQKQEKEKLLNKLKTLNVSMPDTDTNISDTNISDTNISVCKESEKEEREKVPPHPSKERKEEKEKESARNIRVRARELVFPKHATMLDIPPDDILVEPQPDQIKRDEPPNFFDLFCWVRKHLHLDHKRDQDVVNWWNDKIDDGWLDMQGNPLKNWTCHLRVWLKERAKERNAEKLKSQRQSSNTNNINSGLRLRGGTFSPKILEKMKALENGIE